MKKILTILLILVIGIGITAYIMIPKVIYSMVTEYDPYTFEKVLGDTALISNYGIKDNKSPVDYGYPNMEDVEFTSINDGTKLSAWYVPCKNQTDSTIFMIHGRTSNRLKTMKYLQLFQETGLDTLYNIFIADFRNSGKSTLNMKTYMGYKFAEDLAGGMKYLKEEKGQNEFVCYGFSMGAMTIFTFIGRDDLGAEKYDIKKVIVDSPLTNVVRTLETAGSDMGLPGFVVDKALSILDEDMNGYLKNMTMSAQIKSSDIPVLMMTSNHDQTTAVEYTRDEIAALNRSDIQTWYMDSVEHVQIYTHPDYREEYIKRVSEFLR